MIPLGDAVNNVMEALRMKMDMYARWRRALAGEKLDLGERGNPPPLGYFRRSAGNGRWEAFAVFHDDDGRLCCARNIFGNGSKMSADEIDEMFMGDVYAVPYNVYVAVAERGEDWPAIFTTRLRTKDIAAGTIWTEEWARAHLASDPEKFSETGEERPGMGHNNPPEALSRDQAMTRRIHELGVTLADWLKKIGGAPKTQAEAEILGGYANKFKDFENEAVAAHKVEKEPFLKAGREVDAKWFAPVRDKAAASRDKVLAIIRTFEKAEDARRIEEARLANEAARKAAEDAAKRSDAPISPIAEVVPEKAKVSTLRGGGRREPERLVTDLKSFLVYCANLNEPPQDLVEAAEKVARKWKSTGVKAPGMNEVKAA